MAYLSIIVPVYNQAETVLPFYYNLVKQLPEDFELIYVNDGSTDATETELEFLAKKDHRLRCINLTRHYGLTAAVMAGMDHITGTYVIVMKGNLQNPAYLIPEMISLLENGLDIVDTETTNKLGVSLLQRKSMDFCYQLLKQISGEKKHINISEFRAYHNRVIDQLRMAHEKNLMPGLFFNWNDYRSAKIGYEKKVTSRKDVRYTIQHLLRETKKAVYYTKSSHLLSLIGMGILLIAVGSIIIGMQAVAQESQTETVVKKLLTAGALLAGGIWLFIKSTLRFRILSELSNLYKVHQYVVRDVLDNDHFLRFEIKDYKKAGQL